MTDAEQDQDGLRTGLGILSLLFYMHNGHNGSQLNVSSEGHELRWKCETLCR